MDYAAFFSSATGHDPYPFQAKVAETNELPTLLRIPTGAGKNRDRYPGMAVQVFPSS